MSHPAFLFPLYPSNNLRPAKFTPAGDTDTIADAGTERYVVYDLNGTIALNGATTLATLPAGTYIVNGRRQLLK